MFNYIQSLCIFPILLCLRTTFKFAGSIENVISTATVDAGIIVSGRWGTLNEFTNLHDMGKVIGVLNGTGGIADVLPDLYKKIHKPGKAKVFFSSSPEKLLSFILEDLVRRKS